MTDTTIAKNILTTLGGNRFAVMTGAKNFMALENGLGFKLPGNPGFVRDGINYVDIRLNGLDLYDVTFKRLWGHKIAEKAKAENIYADMLAEVFTHYTGLDTHL